MLEVEVFGERLAPGAPSRSRVRELCELAATSRGIERGHVAVEFVTAERIAALNERHRGKAAPTDVLSFPIDVDGDGGAEGLRAGVDGADAGAGMPLELGDIVICPARTADLSEAIVHGMLHLLGMDHETDEGEMLRLQDELLKRPRPPRR
ncbi:MAG TPA: rRNA maturation RNase YbeY [Solirubrobacteraceae bacterium]|jgi:probable rRNA maturation factor